MSEFHYIQLPPDGTGKRSSQTATIEVKYKADSIVEAYKNSK